MTDTEHQDDEQEDAREQESDAVQGTRPEDRDASPLPGEHKYGRTEDGLMVAPSGDVVASV